MAKKKIQPDEAARAARLEQELSAGAARLDEPRPFDGKWTPAVEAKAAEAVAELIREEERRRARGAPGKKPGADDLKAFILGRLTLGRLLGLTPREAYAIAEFAHNCMQHGELDKAQALFQVLVALAPRDAYFHACLGATYQRQGKDGAATEEYSAALSLDPKQLDALVNRAELHLKAGRVTDALADIQAAVKLDRKGGSRQVQRARALATLVASIAKRAQRPK